MSPLNEVARQARLNRYRAQITQRLGPHVIDCDNPAFAALKNNRGKKMSSLDGAILLDLDLAEDGTLRGVISVDADELAAQLPELKKERQDGTDLAGYKKHLDQWEAEGLDVLTGVDDPDPALTAAEELATVDVGAISDFEAKQKLLELQARQRLEG